MALDSARVSRPEDGVRVEPPVTTSDSDPAATATATVMAMPVELVIAWQPSHQADTGVDGWSEYVICGDIVDRTMALLPEFTHVKAWDLSHGLTGSNSYRPQPTNTPAFDTEIAAANSAEADVFVAVHNDGAAPSGVLGLYVPGDAAGQRLAQSLVASLVSGTGLPDRGTAEMRLYSLEAERNTATHRVLLEIGDNVADRAYLESPGGRQEIASALAAGLRDYFGTKP